MSPWAVHCCNPWTWSLSHSYSLWAECGQAVLHEVLWTKDKHPAISVITLKMKHRDVCFSALSGRLLPLLLYSCLKEQMLFLLFPCSSSTTHFTLVLAPWVIGTSDQLAIAPAQLWARLCVKTGEVGPVRSKHFVATGAWLQTRFPSSSLWLWTWKALSFQRQLYKEWSLIYLAFLVPIS